MASSKVNTKTKGKEERGRTNKAVISANDDAEDVIDFTVLRKPVPTSITGFAQARKIFDLATEELQDLLTNECDLLYECKVCRNIFRSLANFISHKRVYCKDKFNTSLHGHFIKTASTEAEINQMKRTEHLYQEALKAKAAKDNKQSEENEERIPLTKDLTAIYEKIIHSRGVTDTKDNPQMVLKKIPNSTVAVFQNFSNKSSDHIGSEVQEIDAIISRDKAVLENDGSFTIVSSNAQDKESTSENVIQISDDEENGESGILKCKICDLQFSTQKTLKFHMKYKHLESRLVYPCPDCLEIFSTSWSVYRHLFKVHRKTAAQIRRLRESIQSKAFKMNNPPAFYEKRKNVKVAVPQKITEEERLDQENQAWMDNMEGDGEVPRCGGCGRTFERRAALAAHTHTCQPRSRALAQGRKHDGKKIEIQIRKDYNKGPVLGLTILKPPEMEINKTKENPPVDAKEDSNEKEDEKEEENDDDDDDINVDADEAPMDVDDVDKNTNEDKTVVEVQPQDTFKHINKLPFAIQAEKSNMAAFRQRITDNVDFGKLICKKCDIKFASIIELYEHMADHVKWMRYACKLCNFKNYKFEKLPEHVKTVHKLKGDSDFYFSTVKAIDGTEAMILSKCLGDNESADETVDPNETSPESRRPSRCSSDSSRLSDDSSSSSTVKEAIGRKRKIYNQGKSAGKKRKEPATNNDAEDSKDGDIPADKVRKIILGDETSPTVKSFEENSSDFDDVEEKVSKRTSVESMHSRRPVRKRTIVKNADFEYDLSNLLKMEAQGYREITPVTKTTPPVPVKVPQPKKKTQVEQQTLCNFEALNKDCCGALLTMSKMAIEKSNAHLRTSHFAVYSTREPRSNIFIRPMLPRIISRNDKSSPRKDASIEEAKESSNVNKFTKNFETKNESEAGSSKAFQSSTKTNDNTQTPDSGKSGSSKKSVNGEECLQENGTEEIVKEKAKKTHSIPTVVPLKFRRQSLELIKKNPLINKNITDLAKAGMKTKILVIKPINRNNDGTQSKNTSLKFQTIKLRDPSRGSSSSDKQSDQVMVVKVPKVPCTTVNENSTSLPTATNTVENNNNQGVANVPVLDEVNNEVRSVTETENEPVDKTALAVNNPVTDSKPCDAVNKDEIEAITTKPESVAEPVDEEVTKTPEGLRAIEVATT